MNNFQYYNPVEMIFGRGLETTVGEHVVRYGGTKVLMVHYGDPYIYESGLHGRIMDSLKARKTLAMFTDRRAAQPARGPGAQGH